MLSMLMIARRGDVPISVDLLVRFVFPFACDASDAHAKPQDDSDIRMPENYRMPENLMRKPWDDSDIHMPEKSGMQENSRMPENVMQLESISIRAMNIAEEHGTRRCTNNVPIEC